MPRKCRQNSYIKSTSRYYQEYALVPVLLTRGVVRNKADTDRLACLISIALCCLGTVFLSFLYPSKKKIHLPKERKVKKVRQLHVTGVRFHGSKSFHTKKGTRVCACLHFRSPAGCQTITRSRKKQTCCWSLASPAWTLMRPP